PLLETSVDGAHGILMNITGGTNLSLFEVQEAADLVTSAADEEVNVIFGSVINENLKDEIVVTVIATGFDESRTVENKPRQRPVINHKQQEATVEPEDNQREVSQPRQPHQPEEDTLDIATVLPNRTKNRNRR